MLLNFEKMDYILNEVFENYMHYSDGTPLGNLKRRLPKRKNNLL